MDIYDIAIQLVNRFDAFIIPLNKDRLPAVKLNAELHKDLPPDRLPSQDSNIIAKWCRSFQAMGIVPKHSFLIIDIDVKPGQNGKASLKFLKDQGLSFNTFIVKTPSGGLHLYYQHPTHYTPVQGSGLRVLFNNDDVQREWDLLQLGHNSSGIDTRYGNGYVVMPGSITQKGTYEIAKDLPMDIIPSNIFVGRGGFVKPKQLKLGNEQKIYFGRIIDKNRNDDALYFTMELCRKSIPDDWAKALINKKLEDYDNSDGDAPTFDTMWDQYIRGKDKTSDIVHNMLVGCYYIITGEKILFEETLRIYERREYHSNMLKYQVPIEKTKANGDKTVILMNPVDIFMESPDRMTVNELIFEPKFDKGLVEIKDTNQGYSPGSYYNLFIAPLFDLDTPHTYNGELMFNAVLDVMANVFTNPKDRVWWTKWLATLIIDPTFRPAWHFHVFSNVRGVGKDTLAGIVRALYGERNCVKLNTDIFTGTFNRDLFNAGLGILSDFTPISAHGKDSANASFKQITGTTDFRQREMFREASQRPLHIRFLFLSNDGTDFPVDEGDRRIYKAKSEGTRLNRRTAVLAHCFINRNKINPEQLVLDNISPITEGDVQCTKALIYNHLQNCGYEEMYNTMDCPDSETKQDYTTVSKIGYISKLEDYIKHETFICSSDVVSKYTLQILLDTLDINTKVETVMAELEQRNILRKIKVKVSVGTRQYRIISHQLRYDKDLDMVDTIGADAKVLVYAIRNFDHWCNTDAKRDVTKEYKKILGVRNLHKWRPKKMKDHDNVVNLKQ